MDTTREILASILFIIAVILSIYLFLQTFSWSLLALAIFSYLAAYWIWPSKRQGQREDKRHWLDLMEIIIELPFRIILWILRLLKNSDVPGIDL